MPDRETASEIEAVATEWAAKAARGLEATEQAEFDSWAEGDVRRLGAFVRAQAVWIHAERAAALGKMPEPADPSPAAPVLVEQLATKGLSRRMVLGGGGALAASLTGAYFLGANRFRTFESGVGEIRRIVLRDDAVLTLDTDSRIDVPLAAGDGTLRLVRGKMFLDITRPQDEPVKVTTRNLELASRSGAFSVEDLADSPIMTIVTKGSLDVAQSSGLFGGTRMVEIRQGHVLTLAPDEGLFASKVQRVDPTRQAQLLAWREGMLSFGGETIAQAVRAFDRYGTVRITVTDPALAQRKITGLFKADDPRGFAAAVAASFDGVATDQGNVIRLSAKKITST